MGSVYGGNSREEMLQYEETATTWSEIGRMKKARHFHAVVDLSLFCSADCQAEDWSLWSKCSATCGGGTRTRERKVVQEPENGGAACQDLEEEESCKTEPCESILELNLILFQFKHY